MNFDHLGYMALDRKEYQEAVNIFRRALEQGESASRFVGLGMAYYHAGDHPTATWAFYQALERERNNGEALAYLERIGKSAPVIATKARTCRFRVGRDCLELFDGTWRRFFVKGVNLGLGLPGHFPGEYPVLKETYLRWFGQMVELGVNAVRIYTVHPPSFYEALAQFNETGRKLFLLQGIWTELPENYNFNDMNYLASVRNNVSQAVDVVYGTAEITARPGYPHGKYTTDISAYTAAFIFGREWEPVAVKQFNKLAEAKKKGYTGTFLRLGKGTPFEFWVTRICDFLQSHEFQHYAHSHPVSVINWPTLDPLDHPSESDMEGGLLVRGRKLPAGAEDMETFDVSGIRSVTGGGFIASYHVYPYYPDFMSNDYLNATNPFLAYLAALKRHHGKQPVLIAEFGMPCSREVSHWNRNGWHQGGHNEVRQGELNGLMMESIHEAGMAGGVLFGWFDEWFKRNWMSLPYELPAERKPLWFNSQDAEENYGMVAAYPGYPGKKVSLAGRRDEWRDATSLYEKPSAGSGQFRFGDGHDDSRELQRLFVQHDEGFLYLRIETAGRVDFSSATFLIGIDTCTPATGEFLLPLNTKLLSPVGLKFIVHLSGKETSRILVARSYDKYLNKATGKIRPEESRHGAWVTMHNKTGNRRISKDGNRFFPARVFPMSRLRFGSLDRANISYDSLADFFTVDNVIELRIPWGLINFTDPSSKAVLWLDEMEGTRTRNTDGIRILAVSYKPAEGCLLAKATGLKTNITDSLPERLAPETVQTYSWNSWQTPVYHMYLKESFSTYRDTLAKIPEGT
jgi:hypothetical protein